MKLVWKGELGDGHVHMTAREYCEHKDKEKHERQRQALRKIANNPILSKETKEAVLYAVFQIDDNTWLRNHVLELEEEIRNIKEQKARK